MNDTRIKSDAGYVEYGMFSNAREGYFCGTCKHLDYERLWDGFCKNLQVSVRTYGCCNHWKIAPVSRLRGANGKKLVRD